ncbi:MAG: membrane or secreted protein [Planctomycetaceae bacterium]|nr:MAG: membrane or secreted protein [Planctomycetaceae bacterium]
MKPARFAWLLCSLLAICAGCQNAPPILGPPGTMRQQQLNATFHDPYTEPDIGPEVVGGRPREYQKPSAEPVRSRFVWDNWLRR